MLSSILLLLATTLLPFTTAIPSGYAWGCLNISKSLPFCDPDLNLEVRAQDLLSRLTLEEKLGLLGADGVNTHVGTCSCMDAGVARLGIPPYLNLVEVNSAVSASCYAPEKCATAFPGPTNMAATFNKSAWHSKGSVISTEMRAFNNLNWYRGPDAPYSYLGLMGYGPNINIERDPRFGRNSELPGEDPYLSGMYAMHYVKGMQEGEDKKYMKMVVGLKHFACYSVEQGRGWRMFNVSAFDLWDTYLKQYRYGFHPDFGNAAGAMCAYSGINGVPACANDYLLNQVVRKFWKRPDAFIASDCGAIGNMYSNNQYVDSETKAAAAAFNGGTDLDLGDGQSFYAPGNVGGNDALYNATYEEGLVQEEDIDRSLRRLILARLRLGLFDPLDEERQPYAYYNATHINTTESHDLVLDLTLQSLVLAKNDNQALPLSRDFKVALLGPHINSTRDLFEDYPGDDFCYGGGYECVPTIADFFTQMYGKEKLIVERGVDLDSNDTSGFAAAIKAAQEADAVVLFVGSGNAQEHETLDRVEIGLPGVQEEFALAVLEAAKAGKAPPGHLSKPVILVCISGGTVSIDTLLHEVDSIVQAFNPGRRGAEALYLSLFGYANRWGRMPNCVYPKSYTSQVDMYDFNMTKQPGRTYRYFAGPLIHFGHGLSYSRFSYVCVLDAVTPEEADAHLVKVSCVVENEEGWNMGDGGGDIVLLVFHSASHDLMVRLPHPSPLRELVAFERVHLASREKVTVSFTLSALDFALTNQDGDQVLYPGKHLIEVYDGLIEHYLTVEVEMTDPVSAAVGHLVVEEVPRLPPWGTNGGMEEGKIREKKEKKEKATTTSSSSSKSLRGEVAFEETLTTAVM